MMLWIVLVTLSLGGGMAEDCSQSTMKTLEYDMNNCIQTIAMKASSELYNAEDPPTISHIICSTQATIDMECVEPMKKCFSPEYISWLVEPMKNYLHEIAIAKVGTQYDQQCKEYHTQPSKVVNYNREEYDTAVNYDYSQEHHGYDENQREESHGYNGYQYDQNHGYHKDQYEENSGYNKNPYDENQGFNDDQQEENYNYNENKYEENQGYNENQYEVNNGYNENRHEENPYYNNDLYEENHENQKEENRGYNENDHDENHEHYYSTQQVMDENRRQLCYETDIYEKMGNCSHYAALKVHYDIQDLTDPNMLNKIACHALNIISTDCVEGLKQCLTKSDANSYINIQVGQWKSYIIEQIESRAAIKLSLDNCHHLNAEYTQKDIQRKEEHEDTQKVTHSEIYKETLEYDNNRHENQGEERCSPSKKQIAEDQVDHCYQSIATNAYNSIHSLTDPSLVSDTICAIQNSIDSDCVKHLKECFTPEYIKWLVEPMKKYLHDLATGKFGIKYVPSCPELYHHNDHTDSDDHHDIYKSQRIDSNEQDIRYDAVPGSEITTNSDRRVDNTDRACSNRRIMQYLEDMSNCSYHTAISVHRTLQTASNPTIISNIICKALSSIETHCVEHIHECYTPQDIRKMKIEENKRMRVYLLKLVNPQVNHQSIDNCQQSMEEYNHNNQENYQQNYHYRNGMDYYNQENNDERYQVGGPNADYSYKRQGIGPFVQEKQARSGRAYKDGNQETFINPPPNEACSNSQKQFADDHLNNCTHLEATTASSKLMYSTDPNEAYAIMCSALTNIRTKCAQYLRQCHSDDFVNWMIEPMKSYMMKLMEGRADEQSLQDC